MARLPNSDVTSAIGSTHIDSDCGYLGMTEPTVMLRIDDHMVDASVGTSLLEAARRCGIIIPSVCVCDREGYEAEASCRFCLVEIEGENKLAPACRREVAEGLVVRTSSERALQARRVVAELTLSEQGAGALRPGFRLAEALAQIGVGATRFGHRPAIEPTVPPHPAIVVDFDACIRCGLCRTACQDVQVNGVIGMSGRGNGARIVFDADVSLSASSCVACGECAQVCPTGALATVSSEPAVARSVPATTADTICPFCSVGCRVELTVSCDRVVQAAGADGPANHGRLCVKGRFGFDFLHHPDRLKVPLIRRDDAPKRAMPVPGPAAVTEFFRPASWDEALDRAAAGLRAVAERHGTDALAVLGSAKTTNEDAYILQKMARSVLGTQHIDHCTRLCASVPPLGEAIGYSAVTAPIEEIEHADVALMVGSNPEVNHPVAATIMKNAVHRGTKLILVDPYHQPFARHATHFLALRPGSDVALLSAMLHVVIAEGLYDRDFVRDRIDGFDDLAARVRGMTPSLAERLTGVDAGRIAAAARLFATADRAMCFWGMGASQHVHGADNIRCVIALALICGHVGKPGSGLHPLRGQNNVQGSCDAGLIPSSFPGYASVGDPQARTRLSKLWGANLPASPGLTQVEILEAAHAGRIRGLYVAGGNPAMANPDLTRTREALARLDHLVVQDIFPTETAAFADVILPATALAERSGSVTNTDRVVQLLAPAVPAPGDARPDWWITSTLAKHLGAPWRHDRLSELFDEMAAVVPMLAGTSWSMLEREKAIALPLGHARSLFAERFPTPSGRGRLVALQGRGPAEEPDADYPLTLVTGRLLEHWHTGSMTRRAPVLDALAPEPVVNVAPDVFDSLGLEYAARVRVVTRRGGVSVAPRLDTGLQAGVIWMPFAYFEAAANDLTNSALDATTRVPEYKYCAARIIAETEG